MKNVAIFISVLSGLFISVIGPDQIDNHTIVYGQQYFTVRGSIIDKDTYTPYPDAKVLVNGGSYTTSDADGIFKIRVQLGDELMVSHPEFETVYHTISSNERITIQVVGTYNSRRTKTKKQDRKEFNRLIDSADHYRTRDAEKSISFIEDALNEDINNSQSAIAHELLGDIYAYWKQNDLAISAYKISIQNKKSGSSTLKLANALLDNGKIETSISTYSGLDERDLSNYEKVLRYEGLGRAYFKDSSYTEAIASYEKGLELAETHNIKTKIADLNSKIAEVYSVQGETTKAKSYFKSSLRMADQIDAKRSVEEQVKVAEFNSTIADYESEIDLRTQAIERLDDILKDSIIPNESALTIQKQNYKIGNAYLLNNQPEKAIPFLEKSIRDADDNEDLVVKKDATRRLSEALYKKGDTDKAIAALNDYKEVVDLLYARKEQEISRVARFSRSIAEQQNRIASLESDRRLSLSKFELTQERNKRQQLIIYSLAAGLVLLLLTGFLMFKYIKQQRLANNLLALKSLRSQMNPHFIFNALNSVNSFIATNDERSANAYLSDFSHLMRAVLENSEEDFIPLDRELELIQRYTRLEQFRFQDKFDYNITIDEHLNTENYQIPPMLLQPYIENAVWHGLRYKKEKGHLTIAVEETADQRVVITITDDGIGRQRSKALKTEHQKEHQSKGMNNIENRVAILNDMYQDSIEITVEDLNQDTGTGTKVEVVIKKR